MTNPSSEEVPLPKHDPLASLKLPGFVLYTSSRVLSTVAQSLLQAALAWQVYEISGSPLSLGLLGLARFFPALGASLVGGLVADTYNRRNVTLLAQMVPLACTIALALATLGGWIELWQIYGLVVLIGLASAFEAPARTALLPAIVPAEHFANAVTVNSTIQKLGSVSGPALAGGIIEFSGTGSAYVTYCAILVVSCLPLLLLKYRPAAVPRQRISIAVIREGIDFVRKRQVLYGAMTLDMFAVIFGGAEALLPVYADILDAGAGGYGILRASMQVGAFAMSFLLVLRPPVQRTGRALILTVVLFGLLTMAFGVSREFWLSAVLYGLIGAADQISVVMRQTTIQMATPDELRGRVSSVNQVFVQASSQIGAMESGFVAALTSATFAVVSGGAGAVIVAGLVAWRLPQLYRYVVSRPPVRRPVPATTFAADAPAEAVATTRRL